MQSAQRLMDPPPLDKNGPVVSDEKSTREASTSPTYNTEALLKESNHLITSRKLHRAPLSNGDDNVDQMPKSSGSHRIPPQWPEQVKDEQSEPPLRRARVSVRARSEAPLVNVNLYELSSALLDRLCHLDL